AALGCPDLIVQIWSLSLFTSSFHLLDLLGLTRPVLLPICCQNVLSAICIGELAAIWDFRQLVKFSLLPAILAPWFWRSCGACPRINPNWANDLRTSPPATSCEILRKTKNSSVASRRKSLSAFTCFSDRLLWVSSRKRARVDAAPAARR